MALHASKSRWKETLAVSEAEERARRESEAAKEREQNERRELHAKFRAAAPTAEDLLEAIGKPFGYEPDGVTPRYSPSHKAAMKRAWIRRLRELVKYLVAKGWAALLDKLQPSKAGAALVAIRDGANFKEITSLLDSSVARGLESVHRELAALIWRLRRPHTAQTEADEVPADAIGPERTEVAIRTAINLIPESSWHARKKLRDSDPKKLRIYKRGGMVWVRFSNNDENGVCSAEYQKNKSAAPVEAPSNSKKLQATPNML